LKPREVTAHLLELIRPTWTPGAMRRASAMEVTPERLISSWLMTKTAAALSASSWGLLATEVTLTCMSWERSISRNSLSVAVGMARAGEVRPRARKGRSKYGFMGVS